MQQNDRINDPVNHELTSKELANDDYGKFLDKLTDVPASMPLQPFSINKAGIVNQSAYIFIRSWFDKSHAPVLCNISMQVELHGHRGIHMSRCEQALFELIDTMYETLEDFAEKLASKLLVLQSANKAYVSLEGLLITKRGTKKSKLISHDKVHLLVTAEATKKKVTSRIGIAAYNITGCPCTETYTKFSVVPRLVEEGFSLEQIKKVLNITNSGTHTQRGLAKLVVDKNNALVTHKVLFEILEDSCHLVFELLKRPDEHELVLRALKKPQFTEDVVREIAANCVARLDGTLRPNSKVFISSLLFDSIHIHDVYTEIEKSLSELKSEK